MFKKYSRLIFAALFVLLVAQSSIAANRVELSTGYFPNPDKSRSLPFAQIYVGIIDLDPEILANQKQISVLQESGAVTPVSQPLLTNAGGVPVYNGSPVSILVDGSYSLKVLDKGGSQAYYVPNTDAYVNNEDFVSGLQTKVTKIDTIADLRTHTGYTGESVQVLGYYTPDGGGGGPVRVWKTGGSYVDNGGSVITPGGVPGPDAWVFETDSHNVKFWGLSTTRTASENTIALSNLFDWVIANGGEIISPELYEVNGISKTGTGSAPIEKIVIEGPGGFKLADNANSSLLSFTYVNEFVIEHIELDGNKANQSIPGDYQALLLTNVEKLTAHKNRIHDAYRIGLKGFRVQSADITENYCYNNGSGNTYPGDGINGSFGTGIIANNNCYENNKAVNDDGDGIQIETDSTVIAGWWEGESNSDLLNVIGNNCYSNGRRGIKVQRKNVNVVGNTCEKNHASQIFVGTAVFDIDNINIDSNILGSQETSSIASVSFDSANAKTITNAVISNNVFSGAITNNGIDIDDTNGIKIEGNHFGWSSVASNALFLRTLSQNAKGVLDLSSGFLLADSGSNNIISFIDSNNEYIANLPYKANVTAYNNHIEEYKVRRIVSPHGVNTALFDIPIPNKYPVGVKIEYFYWDGTPTPVSSATSVSGAGIALLSATSDNIGNITIGTPTISESVAIDGITPTIVWALIADAANDKVTLRVSQTNASSRDVAFNFDIKIMTFPEVDQSTPLY